MGSVGFDLTRVYFSVGSAVWSISRFGGGLKFEAAGSSLITALHVQLTELTSLYWSERNGSVQGRDWLSRRVSFQPASTEGRSAYSVSAVGSRVAWTDCSARRNDCFARTRVGNATLSLPAGSSANDVQVDEHDMYWGDGVGVRRYGS